MAHMPRLILRSSTPGTPFCQCQFCLLSARRDGEIDPTFDSFRRRSWPGSFAGTTYAWAHGDTSSFLHRCSWSPTGFLALAGGHADGDLSSSERISVPSPTHQDRQSNLSPTTVSGRAVLPKHVYLLLVCLVCAGTRPAACACMCMYQSTVV